jgi:hypothetical protein
MSLRAWQWSCAAALTAAVVWMVLPTFPMNWMVDPAPYGRLTTWHSWLNPLVPGYGGFHAPVTALASTVAAIIAWVGLATRRPRTAAIWWAVAAAAALAAGSVLLATFEWPHAVALGLLVAGVIAAWCAVRADGRAGRSARGLPERPSEGVTR